MCALKEKQKSMMKILKNFTLVCCLATAMAKVSTAAERPNIVFILSDDQAWTDYGFMGHTEIKTPHLDKLAERSVLFETGVCSSTSMPPLTGIDGDGALPL